MSFNPRYPASNFPNAVDEINFTPAEMADAVMATQATLLGNPTLPGILQSGQLASQNQVTVGTNYGGGGTGLWGGSGAPQTSWGKVGDYFFRNDTPSTSLQRIYVKTGAATWTGIV